MRLLKKKEKKERALGTRLDLKAFRSQSPKSAMVRRPQKPGMHGKRGRQSQSEYKQQLMEKQKMKISYGLNETQLRKLFTKATAGKKSVIESVIEQLESRLDNVVYRTGFAPSRIVARQVIGHGHILVNGRKVTIPSYVIRVGDEISIKESKRLSPLFKDIPAILKTKSRLQWISIEPEKFSAKITMTPEHIELPFNTNMVVDYYSR